MTISNEIRFAIVGCGHIAHRHAKHLDENTEASLLNCFDVNSSKSDDFANNFGLSSSKSLEDLLSKDFEVLIIATPNASHTEIANQALKAGKHVLIEKPMDIDSSKAEATMLLAKELGLALFVVKQNRYNPPIEKLKELISKGKLGKLHNLSFHCFWNRNEAYYKQSPWRGTKDQDGGVLFTQFSHFIDILYYLFGSPKEVLGFYSKNREADYLEYEDNANFSFRLESGLCGSLSVSTTCFQKNMEGSLTLIAENMSIKIGGKYLNSLEYISGLEDEFEGMETSRPANDYGHYEGSMSNHDKVIQNVINHLKSGEDIMTTGEDGLEVVKIIEQFYKSAVELK